MFGTIAIILAYIYIVAKTRTNIAASYVWWTCV